jgi:uncharacterized protein (TIGR00299 family) protein
MKTIYLECSMGAAGDMITAALFELIDDKENFLKQMNSIGFHDIKVNADLIVKCGIVGTHIRVVIHGIEEISEDATIENLFNKHTPCSHQHDNNLTSLDTVETIITKLNIPQKIKNNATSIYHLLAEAEAYVHGKPVDQIHFHEVGGLDAIVDIVGVCILMETLDPKNIIVSPINVGGGFVHCAHGIVPVPSPATTFMLKNIPVYSNNVRSELCTPTGAAILKHFATRFETMPVMNIQKIGYGMGSKDFDVANYIRAFLGETKNDDVNEPNERIVQLQCNLDDMTGEAISFACNILLKSGALDVFTTSIQMKKNRPAVLLTCICNKDKSDFFTRLILRHTTTFGVRKIICDRYVLDRKTSIHETPYGSIRIKTGEGYSIKKSKPEYNDVAKTAYLNGVTFAEVLNKLRTEK